MKIIGFILLMLPFIAEGQSRINGWKSHISFATVLQVAETPEQMVAASPGGVFYTDREGSLTSTRTKVEGLSDTGITSIAYSRTTGILLIGYGSGNLDLIQHGRIVNIPDITRRTDLRDKTINRISCEGNLAFLCCSFGIVTIDLGKKEIAETWFLGPSGNLTETFDVALFMGSWWVATGKGIMRADQQGGNLRDYRNWQVQSILPLSESTFTSLVQFNGSLYCHDLLNDRLLAYNGTTWIPGYPEIKGIRCIRPGLQNLLVLADSAIWIVEKSQTSRIDRYSPGNAVAIAPRDALINSQGELWIGDYRYGLTRKSGNIFQHIVPNSPVSDRITAMKQAPEGLFLANESTAPAGLPEISYSIWDSGTWQNFTANDDSGLKSIRYITSFAFDKDHPDEYWASTAGSGLLFFQKNRMKARYNELNSTLGALNGTCIINGIDLDKNGNLWYTSSTGTARTGYRSASGSFIPLPYPGMNLSGLPAGDVMTDSQNIHWVVLPDEGLFAFRVQGAAENLSDDQFRKTQVQSLFKSSSTTRITKFREISTVVEDQHRRLWVGTESGVVVYNNPEKIFEPAEFYGFQPSYDNNESLFRPILEKEIITSIAIDGANRKWIGTMGSGVYLFSENGTSMLHHFDSSNSPLFSDEILSIAIGQNSGEVFLATSRGLLSYKSDATQAAGNLDSMYVWPNPLRETYEGGVTIDGLAEETDVRITDITGTLVYHTTSAGGRAVWSARKANGQRVSTGVYLIFCSSPGLGISKIIKLLVIH